MTDTLYRIGDAAAFVNRSVETIRRWERERRIPQARRIGGQRRYNADDLRKIKEIAERPLPSEEPTFSPQPWSETEAETVKPWAETGGEADANQKKLDALPDKCSDCWRSLTRHGITDAHGRRWLQSSCELHGLQKRVEWT